MCTEDRLQNIDNNDTMIILIVVHTFDLFFDGFSWIQPVADVVVVSVLQPKVVLLYDVHLIVDLLQQLLTSGFFLKHNLS